MLHSFLQMEIPRCTRDDVPGTRDDVPGTRDDGLGARDDGLGALDDVPGIQVDVIANKVKQSSDLCVNLKVTGLLRLRSQ